MVANVPRVSVLMPVLKPFPRHFCQAIKGVLRQSYSEWELLIVEEPAEGQRVGEAIVRDFDDARIRYVGRESRTSLVEQLNAGLALAQGEFVARADADDICLPDRLAQQIAFLEDNPSIAVVGSQLQLIDGEGNPLGFRSYPTRPKEVRQRLASHNALAHPSVMFRKAVVLEAGGYHPHRYVEDYDLWCRLAILGHQLDNLPHALVAYRLHDGATKWTGLKPTLRATLAVKRRYWKHQLLGLPGLRYLAELGLLALPDAWVFRLFKWWTIESADPAGASATKDSPAVSKQA